VTAIASGTCILRSTRAGSATIQPVNLGITIVVPGNTPTLSLALPQRLKVGRRVDPVMTTTSDAAPTLTSRTPRICKVGASGRVRAIAAGTCKIRIEVAATATYAARKLTTTVRVTR
jgi:hypothetical protein